MQFHSDCDNEGEGGPVGKEKEMGGRIFLAGIGIEILRVLK